KTKTCAMCSSHSWGELIHHALLAWLGYRRATWPHTVNPHVLVSRISALGTRPAGDPSSVSEGFLVIWAGAAGSDLDDGCPADRLRHEEAAAGRQRRLGAAAGRPGPAGPLSGQGPVGGERDVGLRLQAATGRTRAASRA